MARKILFGMIIFILIFSAGSFAEDWENGVVKLIDASVGIEKEFTTVNMIMNGKDIFSDVPGILYVLDGQTRTLVPVRVISETIGAQVGWREATKEVVINHNGNEIILKINSPIAYVNGVAKTLPNNIAPIIVDYDGIGRTLVPARFISEELGMDVDWVQETRSVIINNKKQVISNVYFTMENRFPEIRIKTSGVVDSSSFYIEKDNEDDVLIVDIVNTELSSSFNNYYIPINLVYYKDIKISTYTKGTENTRLSIGLSQTKGYNIFYDDKTGELVVKFINSVVDIYTDKIYNVDAVVIDTKENPAYNAKLWVDQNKIIIDVMNSLLKVNDGEYGVISSESSLINSIAFSQYDPSAEYEKDDVVSRIVINLSNTISLDEVYIEDVDNKIIVYVSGNPLNGFDYYKTTVDSSQLNLNFNKSTNVSYNYDSQNRNLDIEFNKDSIDISEMNLDIDDSIIQNFSIVKTATKYMINVKLVENTSYSLLGSGTSKFVVNFTNSDLSNSKYKNILVVIDPGHGGKDPGAISPFTGMYEKILALRASLLLKKELENEGFKVYMTRSTDEYISLYERANMANELNANLFISMHINAHRNYDVKGSLVLYNPYTTQNSDKLANYIKNELVLKLGSQDRGIIERPNLIVIRETSMPAVLVELGFLSNKEEGKLLEQTWYLQNAASAIKEAIKKFLPY